LLVFLFNVTKTLKTHFCCWWAAPIRFYSCIIVCKWTCLRWGTNRKLPKGSTTEMKNPAIAKNRLRIILYEQGRTGSIQRLFSWFFWFVLLSRRLL
jgi:hypothetical protein